MNDAEKYKKLYLILQDISSAIVISDRIIALTDYLLDVAIKYVDAESGSLMLLAGLMQHIYAALALKVGTRSPALF
jgi:hypothetical protein